MKTKLTFLNKIYLLSFIFLLLLTSRSYSQLGDGDYNLCVKNIHQISSSVLEFDVFLEWTNPNNTNKFNFFQGGMDFNYAGISNGGVISAKFVSGSADPAVPGTAQNPTWTLNQTSKQIRFLASIISESNSAAVPPPPGWRLGTLRLTNTVPFASVQTNFIWNYSTGSNRTQTKEGFFVNGNAFGTGHVDVTPFPNHCAIPNSIVQQFCVISIANGPYTSCGDVQLNGIVVNSNWASSIAWSTSGSGTFFPNVSTENAIYHPSAVDLNSGIVTLTLTSSSIDFSCNNPSVSTAQVNFTSINDNDLCTFDACDQSTGNATHTSINISCSGSNVICFGANNGAATATLNSGTPPIAYNWTTGSGTPATININPSKDNNIYIENQSNSNAKGEHLAIGNDDQGLAHRALMAFNITGSIPAGSVVTGASLQMHVSNIAPSSGVQTMELHKVSADWGEGTSNTTVTGQGTTATTGDATWLDRFFPATLWTISGGDFNTSSSASTNVNAIGFYSWTSAGMVSDIQNWLDVPASNNGWLIKGIETATLQSKRFDSREVITPSFRPVLTINYIASPPSIGSSNFLLNLSPGTYCVRSTDATGCSATCCYTVLQAPPTNDGNACTLDACNSSSGVITHTNENTDDGIPCTSDGCNTDTGIFHTQVNCPIVILHSNIFLEGYYIGSGLMNNCLFRTGVSSNPLNADLITISAMNPFTPFDLVDSETDTLKTNGDVAVHFYPSVMAGNSYYLKVTHRNALTTWSANPVLMSLATTYTFSDAAGKALGNNQTATHLTGAGPDGIGFAFYSGDIANGTPPGNGVQDATIDATDFLDLDPHIQNGDSGYINSDLNGDGSVDATDFLIMDPNIQQGVGMSAPMP